MISILGCGWLGLPMAEYLLKKGFSVKGSTTNLETFEALKQKGIKPFMVKITDTEIISDNIQDFLQAEVLIVNFPPERRPDIEQYHLGQIQQLVKVLTSSPVKNILFVSSTSVYPDLNREVFEDEMAEPAKGSGKVLKLVENVLLNQDNFKTTVVRFGGLIGDDRMPGRFLAGKKNVENGDAPVNLIHRDDCIELLYQILAQRVWGEVFNACADKHPTRKEFYVKAAEAIGMEPPDFVSKEESKFKIINSDKIKLRLAYKFKYPDPLELLNL